MKIINIGRIQITIELQPKKDPRAFEKLMELVKNQPMKMTEEEYLKHVEEA